METSREPREFVQKYMEDFLSFFGLNIAVTVEEEEETIQVNVPSTRFNGFLIGQHGDTLRSIQYLLNLAMNNAGLLDYNAVVDVADYKKQRMERLAEKAQSSAKKVLETGESYAFRPMNAFERRAVHAAVGEVEGVTTESEGRGQDRHVVIMPTGTEGAEPAQETTEISEEEQAP